MKNLSEIQKQFFQTLYEIQDEVVNVTLCNYQKEESVEELLYDVTYDMAYQIMELFDGYTKDDLKLDIIDNNSKKSLKEGIELHDTCADFLKCR